MKIAFHDSDRTTESLLARRALAEKATPGPWEIGTSMYLTRDVITSSAKYIAVEPIGGSYSTTCYNFSYIAANSPDVVMADIDEILRLREEVERLEKEADWLALVLANAGCGVPLAWYIDEGVNGMSPPDPEHWREAARKAVEENHD